jgi:hypothetical protein
MTKKAYKVLLEKDIPGFRRTVVDEIIQMSEECVEMLGLVADGAIALASSTAAPDPKTPIKNNKDS